MSSLSSSPVAFVTTRWTRVLQAADEASDEAQAALASLCQDYWRPLYYFARRRGRSPQEAQDLTQGFLLNLLESNALARANRERGRFRTFLLAAFEHFMAKAHRHDSAQKRGGGEVTVSLEAEAEAGFEPAAGRTPAEEFERSWALALLDRVLGLLREEYARVGRLAIFEALQPRLTGGDDHSSHALLGVELGLSESGVASALHRLRRRYGELLRAEIAETVGGPNEAEDELRHLLRVLSRP